MSLTERENQTRTRYNQNTTEWMKASGGEKRKSYWPNEMALFVEMLSGDKVLDLGAGPGTDSSRLVEHGLDVTTVDYSRSMLSMAKSLDPSLKLAEVNSYETPFADASFDGIWYCASLLHMEKPEEVLGEIYRILNDNGICFVSVKEGEGEKIDEKTGYYFHYYQDEEIQELFSNCGFKVVVSAKREGTPSHPWLTYHLKKQVS